jgi:hypothetical protein
MYNMRHMLEGRIQELWDDPEEDLGFDGHGRHRLDRYERAPVPWYRTTPAVLAMGAIAVAVIAILVSAVLLVVSRQSQYPSSVIVEPSTSTTTPTTTQVPTTPTTTQVPTTTASASPAPPPPAETVTDPSTNPAPVVVAPTAPRAPNQSPKFNVTQAPVTQAPVTRTSMSVHPVP